MKDSGFSMFCRTVDTLIAIADTFSSVMPGRCTASGYTWIEFGSNNIAYGINRRTNRKQQVERLIATTGNMTDDVVIRSIERRRNFLQRINMMKDTLDSQLLLAHCRSSANSDELELQFSTSKSTNFRYDTAIFVCLVITIFYQELLHLHLHE